MNVYFAKTLVKPLRDNIFEIYKNLISYNYICMNNLYYYTRTNILT